MANANMTMAQYDAYKTPATGGPLAVVDLTVKITTKVDDAEKTADFVEGATVAGLKYKDCHGVEQEVSGKIDALLWDYNHLYIAPVDCPYEMESKTKARIRVTAVVVDASTEGDAKVVCVPVFAITDPGTVTPATVVSEGDIP